MPLNPAIETNNWSTFSVFILLMLVPFSALSQKDSLPDLPDTLTAVNRLQQVRITAYQHNRLLADVPAAVGYLSSAQMQRFQPVSLVQAVNSMAGVRMEERSPGSYRFNIRGSSLRAPFGIRNIKVYYNDIPFTDPGGNTYLNQLGRYDISSMEIIKGPGSSMYGSGTGGVLLIETLSAGEDQGLTLEYSGGSFDSHNLFTAYTTRNETAVNRIAIQHQVSDGFREQSALKRSTLSWNGRFLPGNHQVIKTSFFLGDLHYETPGGLTAAEFASDPASARPGSGSFPGAVTADASISQRTFLAGISYENRFSSSFSNKTVLYGMFTRLVNPNLRGYEKSSLPHTGARTSFHLQKPMGKTNFQLIWGAEWQKGFQTVHVHDNNAGDPGDLRSADDIDNRQASVFVQAVLDLEPGFSIVAASGMNWYRTDLTRFVPATIGRQTRKFSNEITPRLALVKKTGIHSFYAAVSKGFSPPTISELLPTGGAINLQLEAEDGTGFDLGYRAAFKGNFEIDISAFMFRLKNTIVLRRDAGGGDYFINAGSTNQKGVEAAFSYHFQQGNSLKRKGFAWLNYTYHHFRYHDFKQVNDDFSGNSLPGVAPHTVAAGLDLSISKKINAILHYYFSGRLPLNDANSVFAGNYHLLGFRLNAPLFEQRKFSILAFAGGENLLNEKYSLGNDINAFGGRYYNAAPTRSFYAGIRLQFPGIASGDR